MKLKIELDAAAAFQSNIQISLPENLHDSQGSDLNKINNVRSDLFKSY
jgi:hypothetical protein